MLKKNSYFLFPYLLFLIAGASVILLFPKAGTHLFINQYHGNISDTFFKYMNYLGEGAIMVFIILALAFYSFRHSLLLFSSFLFSSLAAQFLKKIVFSDYPRPKLFFQDVQIRFVEGVEVHSYFSFPSGHATSAFALFASLGFISGKKHHQLLCFFAAFFASWSRVHLSQHFLIDIYFGSLLGVSFAMLAFWVYMDKFKAVPFLDKSLRGIFLKKQKPNED